MKKNIIFLFSLFILLSLNGCLKDTGNYDYTELPDIEISGIEEAYSKVSYEDVLEISPVITTGYAESDLEFTWVLFDPTSSSLFGNENYKADTIGREKNLSFPVNLPSGTLTIALKVRNKLNNYTVYEKTTLNTGTRLSRGFYLLKETSQGTTELDLLLDEGSNVNDLLFKTEGVSMSGKASRLGLYMNCCFLDDETNEQITGNALAVISDNNAWTMNVSSMDRLCDFTTMFYEKEQNGEIPYYAMRGMWTAYFLTSKGVYSNISQAPEYGMVGSGKYGLVGKPEGGSKFAFYFSGGYALIYYDAVHGNFMSCDYNGMVKSFTDGTYSPNNIEHKLLFLCPNYMNGSQKCYAIFQDKAVASKHYLYTLGFSAFSYSNPVKSIEELDPGLNLNNATLAASNRRDARIIYFVADNKIYIYDVDNKTETQVNLTGLGANETITYIEHKYWTKTSDKDYNFNYLVVATHTNGNYKVYMYNLLGAWPNGEPVRVTSGTGKIADIQYVSPKFNGTSDQSQYPF
jgi:hypothetical protein